MKLTTALITIAIQASALAQTHAYDFDLVTIGAPGNAPYVGTDAAGRPFVAGAVNYQYRIGRTEVTTSQWMEFLNIYASLPSSPLVFSQPNRWGAVQDPQYTGFGFRYILSGSPNAGERPVYGLRWREAAMFCNWLHNGKSPTLSAIQNGAYDVSTFGGQQGTSFTDQLTRSPGATFWIPSLDEWIKAAHYDPNRYGEGLAGYWLNKSRSDEPGISGAPGVGTTSGGWIEPFNRDAPFAVPVGAYTQSRSPWGLFDTSGATREMTEGVFWVNGLPAERVFVGTAAGFSSGWPSTDHISGIFTDFPSGSHPSYGLRIASLVPAPPSALICVVLLTTSWMYRRRP